MFFQAAEAQETLEEESLAKVESEVRQELKQTLKGDDVGFSLCPLLYHLSVFLLMTHLSLLVFKLETAVADEMATFKDEWEAVLDDLETESSHLLV